MKRSSKIVIDYDVQKVIEKIAESNNLTIKEVSLIYEAQISVIMEAIAFTNLDEIGYMNVIKVPHFGKFQPSVKSAKRILKLNDEDR